MNKKNWRRSTSVSYYPNLTLYAPAVKTTPNITPGVGGGFPWKNDNPRRRRETPVQPPKEKNYPEGKPEQPSNDQM